MNGLRKPPTDAIAAFNIAYMYCDGEGIPKDAYKAIEWFKKTSDLGAPEALDAIGYMYDMGDCGVAKDPHKAREWYKKAANLGVSNSMNRLGNFYEYGEKYGVPKDIQKALEWYKKAADLGNTDAMESIGRLYRDDAIDHGYYGDIYGDELIFSKNFSEGIHNALKWYQKAAEQGDTYAMYNIAHYIYQYDAEDNCGVFIDGYQKALEWYRKIIETSSDTTTFEFKKATEEIPKLEAMLNASK